MRVLPILVAAALFCAPAPSLAEEAVPAPTGTLRAAYIVSNLAQAAQDPATGTLRGVSADIARELARRGGMPVAILPLATAAKVIEAVQDGAADIGFVAPNPDRMNRVLYSQPYMLVQQTVLVREDSPLRSVAELDAPGRSIGANSGDSVGTYLKGRLRHATLRESPDYTLREAAGWLADGTIDAFAGNRQRLRVSTRDIPGLRLLPDNLYGVPQTIAVPLGRADLVVRLDAALDEMRASGFLAESVAASGVDGIEVAPPRP